MSKSFVHWITKAPQIVELGHGSVAPSELATEVDIEKITVHNRLGFYYQDCVKAMLTASPQFKIVADELQLNHQGKTLGAIDFIVENKPQEKLEHWEIAIKFYLLHDDAWFGPNARDRLDLKLAKMFDSQLKLTHHPEFERQYPKFANLESRLMLQGRLYTNPFLSQHVPSHCCGTVLNPSVIHGHWCYANQAERITTPIWRLDKPYWATGEHSQPPLSSIPGELTRALHCIDTHGQFWFVVPNTWPDTQELELSP